MIDIEETYFEWLLTCLDPDGVTEGVAHLCGLLHNCEFRRRVGKDINRAVDGANLRKEFLTDFEDANFDPHVTNALLDQDCSWLEMLIALARELDYLYEGGVDGRFAEMVTNLKLGHLTVFNPHRSRTTSQYDQRVVDNVTRVVDESVFKRNGQGGLFPLKKAGHPDQREVEIWDQHAAYFSEKLEGVLWTSTN